MNRFRLSGALLALLSVWMATPAAAQLPRPSVRPHSTTEERNWMMSGRFARVITVSPSGGDYAEPDAACTYVATQTRSSTATWLVLKYPGNYATDCAGSPVALPTFTTVVTLSNLGPSLVATTVTATTVTGTTVAGTTVTAGALVVTTPVTPASAAEACTAGTVAWDADFVYICTASGAWKRAAIATWP